MRSVGAVTDIDADEAALVASGAGLISARNTAMAIGAGRLALGSVFLADPVFSVSVLGVDRATAAKLTWLARMAAARDIAIGAGTLASAVTGRGTGGWLVAGAVCDATDAVVIHLAGTERRLDPLRARAVAALAGAGTVAALVSAAALRRRS